MKVGRIDNYPWYQELISLAWLVSVLVAAGSTWSQLPARMAVHFDGAGQPNGYSSKGTALALVVGIVLFNWGIDAAIRYQFLTAERDAKRFNWVQFLIVPGVIVSAGCWHVIADFNINGGPFKISLLASIGRIAACLGLLAVTEQLRAKAESEYGESLLGPDLEGPLPERFCLVDAEAPRWWVLLMGIPGVSMIVGGHSRDRGLS